MPPSNRAQIQMLKGLAVPVGPLRTVRGALWPSVTGEWRPRNYLPNRKVYRVFLLGWVGLPFFSLPARW